MTDVSESSFFRPTPARLASLGVLVVLTLTLTARMVAAGGNGVGAFVAALIGSVALLAGVWAAPLFKAQVRGGGSLLKPWLPEYEGPKLTQVVAGGLVALLVGMFTQGSPVGGVILGILTAVLLGLWLHIPGGAEDTAAHPGPVEG
ncbi:hypothetical protein [Micrococcus sp.]|uniref:hypothetical protein n=1 Tax=Micrococcus sp. TaxID=1271 RepID=UPI002A909A3B|nr:hypothetical protein [Micrococcus sp.]MDY6054971.1 hypothetical protein [Micrococcus sp.]